MRRGAFSLIELLVTISVIALLLGIALPVLSTVRNTAQRAKCASQLKGVGVGLQAYLTDSKNVMPIVATMPSINVDTPALADVLDPYLDSPEALHCESDPGGYERSDVENAGKSYFETERSSYAFNTFLGGRRPEDTRLAEHWGEIYVFTMYDYRPFHGSPGRTGSTNYLFTDGHVEDLSDIPDSSSGERPNR